MLQKQGTEEIPKYLTVSEAAEFLGVSPWTLRNWDRAGRLKPLRHPKNGYRIYRQDELRSIFAPSDSVGSTGDRLTPNVDWSEMGETEHFVQFYESDAFLMDSVSGYLGAALSAGDASVLIATPSHRGGIQKRLAARGLDFVGAASSGQLAELDAAECLAQFMVNGLPDRDRFMEVIGGLVAQAANGGRRVRAFGEMVALLWEQGDVEAAIGLEELWNDLAKSHRFTLFCAYPMQGFADHSKGTPFGHICGHHSRVLPAESYAALSTADERLRQISMLQQKARSLEAEIKQREQAQQAMREALKAKDQFLAALSHELRTPLTPVLMAVTAMESDASLPPRLQQELSMIRRNISLETRLIDDLLDLSRVTSGKMTLNRQTVDVHHLIRNVIEMVSAEIAAGKLSVHFDLTAQMNCVSADSARLHQVLWNLVQNAIKFTPEKGTIIIRTRSQMPQQLVIQVQDSGIGIAPDDLDKIFNAFEQGERATNRAFGGLGLGLAISKAVVAMHGGEISAHSDGKGRGACFTIELPAAVAPQASTPVSRPTTAPKRHTRPLRVLLVDDHPDTLKVLRRLLEGKGHSITTATSVAGAVREVEAGDFDILISDIGLPDGTGMDVMRQVRLRHPHLPGIALTGFGMEQDVRNSEQAGFDIHLTKPLDLKQLEAVMNQLVSATTAPVPGSS